MKSLVSYIKNVYFVGVISCFLGCEEYRPNEEYQPSLTPFRELSCSTDNIDFGYYESSEEISIAVRGYDTHWSITGVPDWLTITPQSGYSDRDFDVTISAKANTSTESARTCVLTLKSDEPEYSYSKNIKVTQAKAPTFTGYKTFQAGGVTFKMMHVEAGTFQMGSTEYSDEQPVHSVTITKDYYIGETEVTQALWYAVMGYKPTSSGSAWYSRFGLGDDYPAYYISYEDVQSFLTKLNSMTGEQFRMPTEAEWEFAARGGKNSKGYTYSGSNTIDYVAWYGDNSNDKSHPVKTKAANELGIYDMSGNVWEWCSDWYDEYSSSAQTDPTGPTTGSNRVKRGGSWPDSGGACRCAFRSNDSPSSQYVNFGVRLAL